MIVLGSFIYKLFQPQVVTFRGHIMGTTYSVKYVSTMVNNFSQSPSVAVRNVLEDVDQRMSTYKPNSELMQLNAAYVGEAVNVSHDLAKLIIKSQEVSKMSGGAYDITAGALVNLWGFGSVTSGEGIELPAVAHEPAFVSWVKNSKASKVPDKESIKKAITRVNYQAVDVDMNNGQITRRLPVFIDLSSIAKGYSVDRAAFTMEQMGFDSYMVEVGGEIFVKGEKPDGSPWRVAIQQPDLSGANNIVILDNMAIATSGDYLNYFEVDGVHYSHLIDATTGYPSTSKLAAVAVVHESTAMADALATMFMILGEKKGLALAKNKNINAYFIVKTDAGFESIASPSFKKYLESSVKDSAKKMVID